MIAPAKRSSIPRSRPFEANATSAWYLLTVKLGATADHWGGSVDDGKVHGPITSISILAQPTLRKVGAIDFDEVKLIPALSKLVDPVGAPVATPRVTDFLDSLGVQITHANATPRVSISCARWAFIASARRCFGPTSKPPPGFMILAGTTN